MEFSRSILLAIQHRLTFLGDGLQRFQLIMFLTGLLSTYPVTINSVGGLECHRFACRRCPDFFAPTQFPRPDENVPTG